MNHRADLKKAGDKRDEVYARLEAEYINLQVSQDFSRFQLSTEANSQLEPGSHSE